MIRRIEFDGLEAVEIVTKELRLVLVTQCGPRIAYVGKLDKDNLLYWEKDGVIRGEYRLCGGHRVWLTRPYADESEDTYADDNAPCTVTIDGNTVTAAAPPHPFSKIVRGMRVEVLEDAFLRVTNFITNAGELIYSGGVWSPTCIKPDGTTIRIDLGEENTTWDIVKVVIPRIFAGNTVMLNDPQVAFTQDQMVVKPNGILSKRCVLSVKGRISVYNPAQDTTFTKQVTYKRGGRYPLDGCNIAVFVGKDNWMAEMETFGEEQGIRPGETIENQELWKLD